MEHAKHQMEHAVQETLRLLLSVQAPLEVPTDAPLFLLQHGRGLLPLLLPVYQTARVRLPQEHVVQEALLLLLSVQAPLEVPTDAPLPRALRHLPLPELRLLDLSLPTPPQQHRYPYQPRIVSVHMPYIPHALGKINAVHMEHIGIGTVEVITVHLQMTARLKDVATAPMIRVM